MQFARYNLLMDRAVSHHPNLFAFATSELSQDAALCYWLAWGHDRYRVSHPRLHGLAASFITKLTGSTKAVGEVEILRQHDHVDVAVRTDSSHLIVVEDKTHSDQHGDQLDRYRRAAARWKDPAGRPWGLDRVRVAYIKTGNAARSKQPSGADVVVFGRRDLLALLEASTPIGDLVLEQFQAHLADLEAETMAFETLPVASTWSPRAQEGFYMWLEDELREGDWGLVSNPAGGFLEYDWCWQALTSPICKLYLQLESVNRLQVRVGDVKDVWGQCIPAHAAVRHELLARIQAAQGQLTSPGFRLKECRFRPGRTGAIADVDYDDRGWLPKCPLGRLDKAAALDRLRRVMALLKAAAATT